MFEELKRIESLAEFFQLGLEGRVRIYQIEESTEDISSRRNSECEGSDVKILNWGKVCHIIVPG